ncbi:hypothetical protein PIB30_095722, partial [Stylosanthes scabra]|nr:hypothetical protein [Stylosanthes scabra]
MSGRIRVQPYNQRGLIHGTRVGEGEQRRLMNWCEVCGMKIGGAQPSLYKVFGEPEPHPTPEAPKIHQCRPQPPRHPKYTSAVPNPRGTGPGQSRPHPLRHQCRGVAPRDPFRTSAAPFMCVTPPAPTNNQCRPLPRSTGATPPRPPPPRHLPQCSKR